MSQYVDNLEVIHTAPFLTFPHSYIVIERSELQRALLDMNTLLIAYRAGLSKPTALELLAIRILVKEGLTAYLDEAEEKSLTNNLAVRI